MALAGDGFEIIVHGRARGVSQSRIFQIENGDVEAMELETLRTCAAALGGRIDVTISVGPRSVKVADPLDLNRFRTVSGSGPRWP